MSDDLVSRLREPLSQLPGDDDALMERVVSDRDEAATALEEARAEIETKTQAIADMARQIYEMQSKHDTFRARVREVVGPFGNLAQRYNDTVSDGWIPWIEFITNHEWPSELDCRAARQLMEEVK